jgi:hypothetical protein
MAAPPISIGTADLIRLLTSLLLRYPRMPKRNEAVSRQVELMLTPSLAVGASPPVSGIALRGESEIIVFFSMADYRVNRRHFDSFFGTEDFFVREHYTGEFIPCAVAGGDSIGIGYHGG